MPRESALRDQFRDLINRDCNGHVTNHEDKFQRGVPDCSFAFDAVEVASRLPLSINYFPRRHVTGWVEFKHHHSWPKVWTTELKLGIRPEQRIWIRDRWPRGRDVWLVIRVADAIFMFDGKHVDELFYPISQKRFEELWVGKWFKTIDTREMVELICETPARQ